jgi:hypothetical protein
MQFRVVVAYSISSKILPVRSCLGDQGRHGVMGQESEATCTVSSSRSRFAPIRSAVSKPSVKRS